MFDDIGGRMQRSYRLGRDVHWRTGVRETNGPLWSGRDAEMHCTGSQQQKARKFQEAQHYSASLDLENGGGHTMTQLERRPSKHASERAPSLCVRDDNSDDDSENC